MPEGVQASEESDGGEVVKPTLTMEMRRRPVTHEEALESAQRLIHSHFGMPNGARCEIPVRAADDDVVITDYILEQQAKEHA